MSWQQRPQSAWVTRNLHRRTHEKGRIQQAAFVLNFDPALPFEEMCKEAPRLGMKGFDAVPAQNWPILRKYGLIPTLAYPKVPPPPFTDGIGGRDRSCDHVAWGFEVCKRVSSPRVKLLFDVYHAQITDGDVCRTIRENISSIVHFHVAGVPGRHEPDATQELNFRYIAQTIAELGFSGYVAHEWTPSPGRKPLQSLAAAVETLDV